MDGIQPHANTWRALSDKMLAQLAIPGAVNNGKSRFFEGIAYNVALKERRTVTCSDAEWNEPDEEIFYRNDAVRYTRAELEKVDLTGTPLCVQHLKKLPIGTVWHNWLDSQGHMHIIGEVFNDGNLGDGVIRNIDNGVLTDLSLGYILRRNPKTGQVSHKGIDEVSLCTESFFRGCEVSVTASKKQKHKTPVFSPTFRVVNASVNTLSTRPTMESTTGQQGVPAGGGGEPMDLEAMDQSALIRNVAGLKKQILEQKDLLAQQTDQLNKTQLLANRFQTQDKERREKYATENKPRADTLIQEMKDLAAMDGMELTEDFITGMNDAYLSPEGSQLQSIQIMAHRVRHDQAAQIKQLQIDNEKLKGMLALGANLAKPLAPKSDPNERSAKLHKTGEKRERKGGDATEMMSPESNGERAAVPGWLSKMMGADFQGGAQYIPPPQERGVNAAKDPAPVPVPQQQPAGEGSTPLRPGAPVNKDSMRNSRHNRELWAFMKNMGGVPLDGALGNLAGRDFGE